MKFILLINAKMTTIIVDLLAFICWINTKLRKIFIFQQLSLYELLEFHAQLSIKKWGLEVFNSQDEIILVFTSKSKYLNFF